DSGLARVARTSPWTGLSSLDTLPISRASAAQRAGRAGRVRPGVCVRLYTKGDHDARPLRDRPEIERLDLAAMVLSLRAAGEDPRAFDYLEAPPPAALDTAEALLARLGAIDGAEVTELGRAMLALPLHPRLARVALAAHRRGPTRSGAMLAALIGERDVRLSSRARVGAHAHGARDDEVASSDLVARMDELEAAGASASALRGAGLDARTARTVVESARQIERALADVR